MGSARRKQRDLFEQTIPTTAFPPHLRSKLGALLQALLAEAASGAERHQVESTDLGRTENGDDQDHS